MQLDVGKRYRSTACSTEIVVIKAPESDVDLNCGGYPLSPLDGEPGARNEPQAGLSEGTLIGKRYGDSDETLEVLVTKAGEGTLAIGATPLEVAGARKLPTSD
jgi:hypothetical protein